MKHLFTCITMLAVAIIGGCDMMAPDPVEGTGTFAGTWRLLSQPEGEGCPISFTLTEDTRAGSFFKAGVSADAQLSFCFPGVSDALRTVSAQTFTGDVDIEGVLSLVQPDLAGECAEPVCLTITFLGPGTDENGDGTVDRYSGRWTTTARLQGSAAPLPTLIGTFTVDRQ